MAKCQTAFILVLLEVMTCYPFFAVSGVSVSGWDMCNCLCSMNQNFKTLFANMLLLRILSSCCFYLFFLALQYVSLYCDSSHILFQTVYFGDVACDAAQLPRLSSRDLCHISISCCIHGLSVLPFILYYRVPCLSYYSCANTHGSDTFLTSRCEMSQ